ncbi:unnamed protein product [Chrysoparadoxa australica]
MISRGLLCFLSTVNASGSPASSHMGPQLSFDTDFRYPYPWEVVYGFVLSEKAKGPPDKAVTLVVEGNTYHYTIKLPWYARLTLGPTVQWDDVITLDMKERKLLEVGNNTSHCHRGTVNDISCWRVSPEDAQVTLYTKKVTFEFKTRAWGPGLIMRLGKPLISWFKVTSRQARVNDCEKIAVHLNSQSQATGTTAIPAV